VDAAHGHVFGYLGGRPWLALVTIVTQHFELESGGVVERYVLLAEALLDTVVLDAATVKVLDPDVQ
jgi:hypothetical protein